MSLLLIVFAVSLGVVLYTYLLYPLLLAMLPLRAAPAPAAPREWPRVSLILSVFNEEKHISQKLANLLALDYPAERLRILIGSDGSTDRTDALIQRCEDPRLQLYPFSPRRGKPSVVNRLVPQAEGEILVFTDANAMFEPEALKNMVRHFEDPNIGGVCGRLEFHGEGGETAEGPYWKLETFLKQRESSLDSCLGANGAIFALRRSAWPGIPDGTLVDDFVVAMRVREHGKRVIYEREAVAHEDMPPRLHDEMHRRIRIGAGDYQALFLCWRSLLPWKGWYSMAFWSHKVLRWAAPFFMIAALLSNLALSHHPVFAIFMALQLSFYALALGGAVAKGRKPLFLKGPQYFVTINLSLLMGFMRFLTGTQQVAWKRTAR